MDGRIEAIIIDVDGCLIPTDGTVSSEYYVSLANLSELVKAANRGEFPRIGFCSGRDRNYIEAIAFVVGLPNSWSVIESGIALFNPTTKEMLFNPALTEETKSAFTEITGKRIPKILEGYPGLFLYPGNMICVALERKHKAIITIEEAFGVVRNEMTDLLEKGLVKIHHSDIAIDISPFGIDKASGIKFLSQYTGINLARTLGIGDSNGDFPLFEQTGFVGCPTNASETCKVFVQNKRGYISPFNYASGVADIIEHFVKEG